MNVGYKFSCSITPKVKEAFLLKDLEIWKLGHGYEYEQVCQTLSNNKRLILCDEFVLRDLVPIIDFYGYDKVEAALNEMSKEEVIENVGSD